MSPLALSLIVLSAILHASWNLMAKKQHMTLPYYAVLCLVGALAWSHALVWTPVRLTALPIRFWLFLTLTIAGEFLYCCGIMTAYRLMDMSTAYPLIRSLPILLTATVTTLLGWGRPLSPGCCLGMAVVFCGCLIMPIPSLRQFSWRDYAGRHLLFVLMAACGTTCYTLGDSETQRAIRAGCPDIAPYALAMTYYGIRSLTLTAAMALAILAIPSQRAIAAGMLARRDTRPLLAGLCSTSTYILVLTATNLVDNAAYIPVFRQLGLPVGMLAGIIILKERLTANKCVGVLLILVGLAMTLLLQRTT